MHISPDYIGAAREILEDTYGGTSIFLQGASGDTGPMISRVNLEPHVEAFLLLRTIHRWESQTGIPIHFTL